MIELFKFQIEKYSPIDEEFRRKTGLNFYDNGDPIVDGDKFLFGMVEVAKETWNLIILRIDHLDLYELSEDNGSDKIPIIKRKQ